MSYNDDLNREYSKQEPRFWREAKHAVLNGPGSVRLLPIGQQFGYSEQHIGQIGRTWQNDGLVVTSQSGRVIVSVTPFGRRFTFEDRYQNIE